MVNLTKLTVAQLKDELTKRGVSYKKCKRKADYVQTLEAAIAQANQSPEETGNAQEAAHSPPQGIAVPNTVEVVNNDTGSQVPDNVNNQDDSRNNAQQPTDVVVSDSVANVNDSKVSDDRGIAEGSRQADTKAEDCSVGEQPRAHAPVDTNATESTTNTEEVKTHKRDTESGTTTHSNRIPSPASPSNRSLRKDRTSRSRSPRSASPPRRIRNRSPRGSKRSRRRSGSRGRSRSRSRSRNGRRADRRGSRSRSRSRRRSRSRSYSRSRSRSRSPRRARRRADDETRPIARTDSSDKNAAKASTTTEISKTTAAAAESLREKLLASKMSKDKVNAGANANIRTSAGVKEQEKGSKEKERDSAKLLAERAAKALREKLLKGRQQRESIDDVRRQESLDSVAEMINEEAEQAEEVRLEEERRLEKVREAEKKAQEKTDEEQRMADETQRKADAEQREADEKQVRADEQERSADETSSVVDEEMREEKRTGEKRGRYEDEGDAHESDKKARRNSDGDGDVDDRDADTHVEVTLKLGDDLDGPVVGEDEASDAQSLLIENLCRPLTNLEMVDLLTQHGDLVEDDAESGSVGCWMDKQRTKCCCTFQTYDAAASALNAIDGIKWPQGNQKQLSVTFISLSEAHALCQSASGKGRVAVASQGPNGNARRASAAVEQERLKAREAAQRRKSEAEKEKVKEKETKKVVDEKKPRKVVALDQIFRKTTAEPPLYWMEVDAQEIEKRRAELKNKSKR